MMMQLYYSSISNYCSKVKLLIEYKKIDIEFLSPPGGYGSDEFKKISPQGTIPTLISHNITLCESEAINEYLNAKFPNPRMLSSNNETNGQIRYLSRFHDLHLEPMVRYFFQFKDKSDNLEELLLLGFNNLQIKLDIFENILKKHKYIAADFLSLADCGLPSFFALCEIFKVHFKKNLTYGIKVKRYFNFLIKDNFLNSCYEEYHKTALEWSKNKLVTM